MPDNIIDKEFNEIKEINKKYIEHYGLGSFFGLIAELFPRTVDQEDLKKHEEDIEREAKAVMSNHSYFKESMTPSKNIEGIAESGMYRKEALPAVLDDFKNTEQNIVEASGEELAQEHPKTRVLENKSIPSVSATPKENSAPNPWGDAEVVSPGHLKL